MEDSERLVVESLHWACAQGATALNYVRADALILSGVGVAGVRAMDRVTGQAHDFRARRVINTAGPWARELAARLDRDLPELWRPTLAFNLAIRPSRRPTAALAVAPRPPGEPTFFLVPWKQGLLAGTQHVPIEDGRRHGPTADEVAAFKQDVARSAPGLGLEEAEVNEVYWGWLPGEPTRRLGLATAPTIVHHDRVGGPRGLTSVVGVKFTTARAVAERVLQEVWGERLPAAAGPRPALAHDVPLVRDRIMESGWRAPEIGDVLSAIAHEEAVLTVEDLVQRRLAWGPFVDPPGLDDLARDLDLVREATLCPAAD
jgi:glycerol-3-phosphate dehydrogenase